jgi:uracil-DNA glycosylase
MISKTRNRAAQALHAEIAKCQVCAKHLPLGPRPVVRFDPSAQLLIIGQAPGTRVHESGVPWNDASGERLRDWLGLSAETFYDPRRVALMPMGFCYPGVVPSGGDRPPRPECAPLWHDRIRSLLPEIRLTLLVGQYAQQHYLSAAGRVTLTERVRDASSFLPDFLPLPHPSWRSTGWLRKNSWFEMAILPVVRKSVIEALNV